MDIYVFHLCWVKQLREIGLGIEWLHLTLIYGNEKKSSIRIIPRNNRNIEWEMYIEDRAKTSITVVVGKDHPGLELRIKRT